MGEVIPFPVPAAAPAAQPRSDVQPATEPRPEPQPVSQSPAEPRPASRPVRRREPAGQEPSGPEPLWRDVVGEELRAARAEREERIADVAERAGMSPQYLSEVERGRKDPSSEMLAAVAGALGLTVHELSRRIARRYAVIAVAPPVRSRPSLPTSPPQQPLCLAA